MGDKSKIEWTDASWNPFAAFDVATGKRGWFCTKVSEGCRNCYAERVNLRLGNGHKYTAQNLSRVRFELVNLDQPFRWKHPRLIFVNSMTDLFGDFVSDENIAEVFKVMSKSPRHIFQVLTKRPERMLDWISRSAFLSNAPLRNVWLGISAEDKNTFLERAPLLVKTPAAVKWISLEPLIGPMDFESFSTFFYTGWTEAPFDDVIDWVVIGGESGPGARPMHPEWARYIRDKCAEANVPFFFKQWGAYVPGVRGSCDHPSSDGAQGPYRLLDPQRVDVWHCNICGEFHDGGNFDFQRVGKRAAGRLLDGREWNEYPDVAEGGA